MENPFAPPQADISPQPERGLSADGAYRDGELLVISRSGARLPDVCVKTGAPTGARMNRKLYWHPPWVYIFLLFNIIIFAIVALIARKVAELDFAVCDEARDERKKHIWIGVGGIVGGIGLFALLGVHPAFALVGGVVFLAGLIYIAIKARLVWPTKMDKEWAWIKGVDARVLAQLPPWAGP